MALDMQDNCDNPVYLERGHIPGMAALNAIREAENQKHEPPFHKRLDALNDEFFVVRRLLGKPGACMSAPEIMDVLRIAVDRIHSLYEALAMEMRAKEKS